MDFDTSRSGTAPNPPMRKMPQHSFHRREGAGLHSAKPRPSTRGAGSDIADLNASLRHDRTDSHATAYSEAVESYREAIFSWGEPDAAEEVSKGPDQRFKHPKSAYASSVNKVRLRPSGSGTEGEMDSDTLVNSANLSSKVANVSAIYGVSSKKAKAPSLVRKEVPKSRPRPNSRPSSPMTGTSSNLASSGFGSPSKKTIQRNSSDSGRPVLAVSTNVVASKSVVKSPLGQTFLLGGNINPNSVINEQVPQFNFAPDNSEGPLVSSTGEPDVTHNAASADAELVNAPDIVDHTSGILSVETSPPESGSRSGRPQSRKLYLGSGQAEASSPSWSASPASNRRSRPAAGDAAADAFSASAPSSPKVEPPSASLNVFPTQKSCAKVVVMTSTDISSPKQSPKLSRNKSFPQVRPAPWNADESFDDRPPSRQGTAFPFHLAGSDGEENDSGVHAEGRGALSGSVSTPVILDSEASSPHAHFGKSSPVNILGVATPSSRPGGTTPPTPILMDKRRSSLPASTNRPTTRGAGSHSMASSPILNHGPSGAAGVAGSPVINTSEWAPVYDPVADGFSDIIPEGPPTFTIEFNNVKSGHHRKPRPLSGVAKSGVAKESLLEKMDADLDIVETSPARPPQGKPATALHQNFNRDRVYSVSGSKGTAGNKSHGNSGIGSGNRAYPLVPNAAAASNGRLQHRHLVASSINAGTGKKTSDKFGQAGEQRAHSPSSEDEAYYMSSWTSAKKEKNSSGIKTALMNHPSSAPSKKIAQSGTFSRNCESTAWQPSVSNVTTANAKPKVRSGPLSANIRSEGNSVGRTLSGTSVPRSRSASNDADGNSALGGYGASGSYFTSSKNSAVVRMAGTKATGSNPLVLSDFEDEDVCVTSDDDEAGDEIYEDVDTLSEDSDSEHLLNCGLSLQSLNLETSLGEDFLSLFARG